MKTQAFVSVLALAAIHLLGCSSKGSSSSSNLQSCGSNKGPPGSDACGMCQMTKCDAELSAALGSGYQSGDFSGSACSDYLDCTSQCSCDISCIEKCGGFTSACMSAFTNVESCTTAHCSTECNTSSSTGTGTSSTGTGSASSSSGGTGDVIFSCYVASQFACSRTTLSSSLQSIEEQGCTASGGVAGTTCPAADLIGCCNLGAAGAVSETCVYVGYGVTVADEQATCEAALGTWSTTP